MGRHRYSDDREATRDVQLYEARQAVASADQAYAQALARQAQVSQVVEVLIQLRVRNHIGNMIKAALR